MKLIPENRHLLVEPVVEKQKKETSVFNILTPDDYKEPESVYALCEVIDVASNCSVSVSVGDAVVVERRMLHKVDLSGKTFYLVLENYVYGRLQK